MSEITVSQPYEKPNVVKYKLLYTGIILLVYELGRCIPLYGISASSHAAERFSAEELLLQTLGGDAYSSSIFALGIFPTMISALLVQIAMALIGCFSKAKFSPGKIARITAAVTLAVGILQAASSVRQLEFEPGNHFSRTVAMIEMVTGSMLILWLSHRITRYGLGGQMVFGLVNILQGITSTLFGRLPREMLLPLGISAVMIVIMLVMENAELRIPVQRISIHNIYADKNYMAFKLNPVGVMPMMFCTAVFTLPKLLLSLLGYLFPENQGIMWWQENLSLDTPVGITAYVGCLYVLTIFLTMMFINPKDITEQFLKSGDSIVDLHAGRDTKRYLRAVTWCMSLFSATVMGVCVAAPLILELRGNLDSTLVMLPTRVMMFTGLWCNLFRELASVRKYDLYRPLL